MSSHIHAQTRSVSSIQTMDRYRETWNRSMAEGDALWLGEPDSRHKRNPRLGGDFTLFGRSIQVVRQYALNITTSCRSTHCRPRKNAILWEGDEPDQIQRLTYTELLAEVCKLANVLKANGVEKGDRVIIYMGMTRGNVLFVLHRCGTLSSLWGLQFQCASRSD